MAVSKRIRTDLALETTERFKEENTEIRRCKRFRRTMMKKRM